MLPTVPSAILSSHSINSLPSPESPGLQVRLQSQAVHLLPNWNVVRGQRCPKSASHNLGQHMHHRKDQRSQIPQKMALLAVLISTMVEVMAEESADSGASERIRESLTVTAPRTAERVLSPQVELGPEALAARQAPTVSELLRALPGVSARTNSRGETIARVRGADERQTAVFLDGAPFSVPWDGRIDLGVLPAGLLGRVLVTKGATPIEFGANAVSGVVELETRRLATSGEGWFGKMEAGTLGYRSLGASATFGVGAVDVTLGAGHVERDAQPLADREAIPFSQNSTSRRTNTDLKSTSGYVGVGWQHGIWDTRFSILANDAERGIAPESDRDPAQAAPRYWRYPDMSLIQATLNVVGEPSPRQMIRAVLYGQWYEQTIDAYRTAQYNTLSSRQMDEDRTRGGRLTYSNRWGSVAYRLSGSFQRSRHQQVDTPFPSGTAGPRLAYEQVLSSIGAETDLQGPAGSRVTLSAALDRASTPLTGDKPGQPALDAPAFSVAWQMSFGEGWQASASLGRRTRFASARELFGEALGRFLINPDLKPEQAWLADIEVTRVSAHSRLVVNPFYVRGTDTISQRIVRVDNVNRRQRFNLGGTRTYGVEASYERRLSEAWRFNASGQVTRALADAGDAPFRRLVQRPSHEVTAGMSYSPNPHLKMSAEVIRTGRAEDDSPTAGRVVLAASTELALRGRWTLLNLPKGGRVALTAALDNLTNAHIEPQLGLPRPGRSFRVGVSMD